MTETQLQQIEDALQVRLPDSYRAAQLAFPFVPFGEDTIYWFYDDPEEVINDTRNPLLDGDYDGANWRTGFVAIGRSAMGDLYLIDTTLASSPVYCLSHEDHSIEEDFPDLEAYLGYWHREIADAETADAQRKADQARAGRALRRRAWMVIAVTVLGCALCLLLLSLIPLLRDWNHAAK